MGDNVYFFMDQFSILIVVFLFFKVLLDSSIKKRIKILFLCSLISELLMFSVDALNNITSEEAKQIFVMPIWLNITTHFLYFFNLSIVSYVTFLLIDELNEGYIISNKKVFYIAMIPSIILGIISFVSMFTGWMFTIDSNSIYHRGPLNFLQMVFPAMYILVYLIISIHHLIDKHYYAKRKTYTNTLIYCIAPITGGTLQFIFPKVPFLIAGIVFATLMMYVHVIQNQVSIDYLTNMNNRSTMDKYLSDKIKNHNKELYLLMMDIDNFKFINDTYGHIEGDNALKIVAKVLNALAKKTDQFVARYGGDEFSMVLEIEDDMINDYITNVKDELAKLDDSTKKYKVRLSIGFAKLTEDVDTVPLFIAKADKMLYSEKTNREKI